MCCRLISLSLSLSLIYLVERGEDDPAKASQKEVARRLVEYVDRNEKHHQENLNHRRTQVQVCK
jgi:hypothetical protein